MDQKILKSGLLFMLFILSSACNNDKQATDTGNTEVSSKNSANEVATTKQTSLDTKVKLVPKPKQVLDEQEKIAQAGPFYAIGCCKTKAQRLQLCCCDLVIEQYKTLKKAKDSKLVDYSTTDPILGGCRRSNPKIFDDIDHPKESNDFF